MLGSDSRGFQTRFNLFRKIVEKGMEEMQDDGDSEQESRHCERNQEEEEEEATKRVRKWHGFMGS